MGVTQVNYYLYTDSSSMGWGAHLLYHTASGTWSNSMKESHINVLELMAIWLGLQAYDSRLQCRNHVRQCFCHSLLAQSRGNPVAPDVRPSIAGLHVGRVKSCNSNTQTSPWSLKRASGSIEQEESNSDNRMESPSDCSGQSVPTLGQTDSRSKIAIYMSPVLKPKTWKVDSLVQSWKGLYAYAYPPTTLIKATLSKLVLDFPLELPVVPKLLKQSLSHIFHKNPERLNLQPIPSR